MKKYKKNKHASHIITKYFLISWNILKLVLAKCLAVCFLKETIFYFSKWTILPNDVNKEQWVWLNPWKQSSASKMLERILDIQILVSL